MDMDQYKGMEEEAFWFEMQEVIGAIDELVHKYDLQDRVISAFVLGLLEPLNDDTSNMKAFFHYNMQSNGELDIVKDFMTESYVEPTTPIDDDLEDLLGDLGISLN